MVSTPVQNIGVCSYLEKRANLYFDRVENMEPGRLEHRKAGVIATTEPQGSFRVTAQFLFSSFLMQLNCLNICMSLQPATHQGLYLSSQLARLAVRGAFKICLTSPTKLWKGLQLNYYSQAKWITKVTLSSNQLS